MKYWQIVAGQAQRCWLIVGLLQLRYAAPLAIGGVDANRGDGRRFIVESDEKLTAFSELEATLL